jgi:hypothetical protein
MLRFWKLVSLVAATLAGLATFLVYLPKIASDTIPYLENVFWHSPPQPPQPPQPPKPPPPPQPRANIDDKYVLPVGVTTREFTQCLSTLALVDGRDFTIKEVSTVYRVIVLTRANDLFAAGYDVCRQRLARR